MARSARAADRLETRTSQRQKGRVASATPELQGFERPRTRGSEVPLKPLTEAQVRYDQAIKQARIAIGYGSAGTGKTWWASNRAADALRNREIEKLILTRPMVEAGERMGFLPGTVGEKFEPYLAPLASALEERLGAGSVEYFLRHKIIEILPLAFMRGATFKNTWVIADEMQNATKSQFKLLLSRLGEGSKIILNGDSRQLDIPHGQSGLEDAVRRLSHLSFVRTVEFTPADVVRDPVVQAIVEAYEDL